MKMICYGDSNTYGYDPRSFLGGRYPTEDRWVDILAKKLGWESVNAGMNGREIPQDPVIFEPADLLLIMLGTNDLLQGKSPEAVQRRMKHFLSNLDFDKSRILLIIPPPLKLGAWVPNQALVDASKALNLHGLGVRCVGPWDLPTTFDGVHLTEEGHAQLAEFLYQTLQQGKRSIGHFLPVMGPSVWICKNIAPLPFLW